MDDKELEKQAIEELLQEAKRGKQRSSTMGPSGWQKNLIPTANKQFLRKTIASSLHSHKIVANRVQKKKDCATNNDEIRFGSTSTASDINYKSPAKEKTTSGQNKAKRNMQIRPKPYAISKAKPKHHKSYDECSKQKRS